MKLQKTYILLFIFLFALIIRLGYVLLFSGGLKYIDSPDSIEYNNYAVNLIDGNGYRNGEMRSFRPPGYPFFLAGIYILFGHSYPAVKIIQVVLSAFTCVIIFLIGSEIGGRRIAVFSGFYSCIFYSLFEMSSHVLSETLFTFLLCISILFFLKMDKSLFYKIGAPVFLGLATLTRSSTLIFPFFIFIWFVMKYPLKKAAVNFLLTAVIFFGILTPWTIRNYMVHHAFVPIHIQAGLVFWGANNPIAGGKWNEHGPNWEKYSQMSELEKDNGYFKEGLTWLKSQPPFPLIKLYVLKTCVFFYPFFALPDSGYDITYGLILPFWILGMYGSIKSKDKQSLLLFSVILVFFVTTLIFYTNERLRSPICPFVIIFAAIGIYFISDKLRMKNHNYHFFAAWSILNILIYLYSEPIHSTIIAALKKIRGL